MMKNILVLTGSPRSKGNSDLMADAFIKGAISNGHKVTKFEAAKKKIGGCRACDKCWSRGTPCIFQDDFSELVPLLENADMLVLATPLYSFSMSAQMKAAIDRLYAYDSPNRQRSLNIKESALLVCAGDSDVFDGIIHTYNSLMHYLKVKDVEILTVPNVNAKGDILKTDALAKAELLGARY
ncbi:flavodoxin family protein [Lacrimispora sp.]|jgi:multimeric flavodoxin WrbA|uniref:flavodoxin family protein n=1 Tax=Lacrimispora sp. TaxID=2719234 RepID=UPI0028A5CCCB|nr:flavodoxin family protein [Lacrimispora sp.]